MYAVSLLEHTGICVVPASGFGQAAGRFGFRTTFLPATDQLVLAVERIKQHHLEFVERYARRHAARARARRCETMRDDA
jgi:alanine transaminase